MKKTTTTESPAKLINESKTLTINYMLTIGNKNAKILKLSQTDAGLTKSFKKTFKKSLTTLSGYDIIVKHS